jgi:hypothetical protein
LRQVASFSFEPALDRVHRDLFQPHQRIRPILGTLQPAEFGKREPGIDHPRIER